MWTKAIKKLVCLHLIVAALLFLIVQRNKEPESEKDNRGMLMGAIVLLSIATFVCFVGFLRSTAMAISGGSEISYDRI